MIAELFLSALMVWLAGAVAALALWRHPAAARRVACGSALAGSLLDLACSSAAVFAGNSTVVGLPFGNPAFVCAIRIDPLSAYFNVTLAVLAAAVSLYSFGYLRQMEGRQNLGAFGFFLNLLLLSLALVFTASNAFFFLVAWEAMALVAFCLISFEHEKEKTRKAGVLFLIMSHAGTGLSADCVPHACIRQRQPGFLEFPPAGFAHAAAPAGRDFSAFSVRLWREGGAGSRSHLAARCAPGCAQQCFGADVGHRDQDRHLRHGARLLRFLRSAAALDGNRGAGAGRGVRAAGSALRADGARPEASARLAQHREYRHHPHGFRRGADVSRAGITRILPPLP